MTTTAAALVPQQPRRVLDARFVGKTNADAMRALGDVVARRKWATSKSGSPITTNLLCAEIARLSIINTEMLAALQALVKISVAVEASVGDPTAESTNERLAAAEKQARAAIARATGAAS